MTGTLLATLWGRTLCFLCLSPGVLKRGSGQFCSGPGPGRALVSLEHSTAPSTSPWPHSHTPGLRTESADKQLHSSKNFLGDSRGSEEWKLGRVTVRAGSAGQTL